MSIPAFLPYYVLAGTQASLSSLLYGLHLALGNAGWPSKDRNRTMAAAAAVLLIWLACATALSVARAFHAAPSEVPTIQYAIFVPIILGCVLIWRSPLFARIIDAVPQSWLVGIQLYRALGVIFLILYATGRLPGLFAWPAGIGDIIVGLLAPAVALSHARNPVKNGHLVLAWNAFGIADLIVAVAIGFVSAPSLVQPFAVEPPNELITLFPLALIPTFLVPLSILLHLASLAKLRRDATPSATPRRRRAEPADAAWR